MALSALTYFGGKSYYGNSRTGLWVARQLPYSNGYCEPFAGMLGVLLQRRPSSSEIVNDTNSRLTNWWRQVRDQPEELARRLELTPVARDEWDNALANVDSHPDPIERARMFTVLVHNSMAHIPNPGKGEFVVRYTRQPELNPHIKIAPIAARIKDLQIENIDANRLLEKTVNKTDIVIYCDPPYADARGYDAGRTDNTTIDRGRLTELLKDQKGKVAISGYNNEWDHLGWRKTTRGAKVAVGTYMKSETHHSPTDNFDTKRTEALWSNYPPSQTLF